ncbi:MAG: hypothetical protein LBH59_10170 [Planctomycetaceae bacterium]|nr:hypothetical protein [Planctomycetaceae bacterium]
MNSLNVIPKPVWAVGFALEQTLHVVALTVFSFLILKRLQHISGQSETLEKQLSTANILRERVRRMLGE